MDDRPPSIIATYYLELTAAGCCCELHVVATLLHSPPPTPGGRSPMPLLHGRIKTCICCCAEQTLLPAAAFLCKTACTSAASPAAVLLCLPACSKPCAAALLCAALAHAEASADRSVQL